MNYSEQHQLTRDSSSRRYRQQQTSSLQLNYQAERDGSSRLSNKKRQGGDRDSSSLSRRQTFGGGGGPQQWNGGQPSSAAVSMTSQDVIQPQWQQHQSLQPHQQLFDPRNGSSGVPFIADQSPIDARNSAASNLLLQTMQLSSLQKNIPQHPQLHTQQATSPFHQTTAPLQQQMVPQSQAFANFQPQPLLPSSAQHPQGQVPQPDHRSYTSTATLLNLLGQQQQQTPAAQLEQQPSLNTSSGGATAPSQIQNQILSGIQKYIQSFQQRDAAVQSSSMFGSQQAQSQPVIGTYDSLFSGAPTNNTATAAMAGGHATYPPEYQQPPHELAPPVLTRAASQETAQFSQIQMSSAEFQTLHQVVTSLNTKIVQMNQQTQSLEEKLLQKQQEIKRLKKKSVSGSTDLRSTVNNIRRRSTSKRKVVVAREKATQTPVSFLSAKQTRLFLNQKHTDLMGEEKRQLYYDLNNDVAQQDEFLDHIKTLEGQIQFLEQALAEKAPSFKAQSHFRVSSKVSPSKKEFQLQTSAEKEANIDPTERTSDLKQSHHKHISHLNEEMMISSQQDVPCQNCHYAFVQLQEDHTDLLNKCKEAFHSTVGQDEGAVDFTPDLNDSHCDAKTLVFSFLNSIMNRYASLHRDTSQSPNISLMARQLQSTRQDLENSSLAVEYLQKQNEELNRKIEAQERQLSSGKPNQRSQTGSSATNDSQQQQQQTLLIKKLQNEVAQLQGELEETKSEHSRRLETSAQRKDETQKELVEQLKQLSLETGTKQSEIEKVKNELKMKDKMIEQLTSEINRQAWQFKQEQSQNEAKKKQAEKERIKAIFSKAKASSQGGNSGPSSQGGMSPRDANLKVDLAAQAAKQLNAVEAINKEISMGHQPESVSPNRLSQRLPLTKRNTTPGRDTSNEKSSSAKRRRSTLVPFGGF